MNDELRRMLQKTAVIYFLVLPQTFAWRDWGIPQKTSVRSDFRHRIKPMICQKQSRERLSLKCDTEYALSRVCWSVCKNFHTFLHNIT